MSNFREHTLRCLKAAGWSEDYRYTSSDVVARFREQGFKIFPELIRFLDRFGNLRLTYPHFRDPTLMDACDFDAGHAADAVFPEVLAMWEAQIGGALTPIGEAFKGYMTLLMSVEGVVYAGMDAEFFKVGASGEEAIEVLCEGREPVKNRLT